MPEETLDLGARVGALSHALPHLGPVVPLRSLGRGFRSLAVEPAGGVVFRIGHNAAATHGHERELRLLLALSRLLPVAIPQPRWQIRPCPVLGVAG